MLVFSLFFFNDTATTEIYTLSLHDALPISDQSWFKIYPWLDQQVIDGKITLFCSLCKERKGKTIFAIRSEEHTSELQSQSNLVCRLLLEKKKYAAVTTPQPKRSDRISPSRS